MAVASTDAAVSTSPARLGEKQAQSYLLASTPFRSAAPARSAAPTGMQSPMAILERAVVDRMNQVRRGHGLRALRISRPLAVVAERHSNDMARRGYFEHDSASGTAFWRRIERFYPSRGFRSWTVGENLLWAGDTYSAAFAVQEWMNSPPHRKNILSRQWREVGIGAVYAQDAQGEYRGGPVTITTADFGARR